MSPQQSRVSLRGKNSQSFPPSSHSAKVQRPQPLTKTANVCIVCCDSSRPRKSAISRYLLTVLAICPALSFGLVEVSRANIAHCALEPQLLGTCANQTRR
ncbi:hypothetical protein CDEST_07464 [Colletotrichum destructivum]|uniref:Uncharacterized protein n=1 Tax=Colletotrichum destructivum TaxID=34406 RepID=A0AAX4IG42_9PEZI|nr:hypothetical protein CDEST_07464 [Colletotrichum destructivum]